MKILKKILIVLSIVIIVNTVVVGYSNKAVKAQEKAVIEVPIKVGILLYRFDDDYISLVRQSFEEIKKETEGKVEFTFYDGKNDQSIQNETLDTLLEKKSVDLLFLNLVDVKSTKEVINNIKENNIPVVLFNREPLDINAVKSYSKAYFVGTDAQQAGELQGKILINAWNTNKAAIDKNNDNIMQYIMLMGEHENLEAIARTKYSVSTINKAGIKTQELSLKVCNWNTEIAKDTTKALFLQFGNKIEVIISNNDAMAIGAISALQEYGFNKGNVTQTIPVVGVDAIPAAQELIKKGFMAGSVIQDATAMADAIYKVGMNLVYNKSPLDGTEYKFDDTEIAIRIPYREYSDK